MGSEDLDDTSFLMNMSKNTASLPKPLPQGIRVDNSFLEEQTKQASFDLYKVVTEFFPTEKRHIGAAPGQSFSGCTEINGWVFGFVDTSPSLFGFVPKTYLEFERTTGADGSVTPTKFAKQA
jgi:hypothetical protein